MLNDPHKGRGDVGGGQGMPQIAAETARSSPNMTECREPPNPRVGLHSRLIAAGRRVLCIEKDRVLCTAAGARWIAEQGSQDQEH